MDINCPYCQAEQNINHDDDYGYQEEEVHQQECNNCLKNFIFTTSIIYSYYPEKADYLNGSPHDYKPTRTFPRFFVKMECSVCEERREPTKEERVKHDIPTIESYLESIKQTK